MDVHNTIGGSLQISTEVIAKIARLAALEVDGVADVATGTSQNVCRSRSPSSWRTALPP